jgi:hypothetical protein
MKRIALIVLAGSLISGCAINQLNDFKKAEASKNYAAIADKKIDSSCFADQQISDECAQLTEIQGRACMNLALQETAPNAACPPPTDTASRHLQCAAHNFGAAVKGGNVAASDLNDYTEMRARALYCGATLVSRAEGLPNAREAGTRYFARESAERLAERGDPAVCRQQRPAVDDGSVCRGASRRGSRQPRAAIQPTDQYPARSIGYARACRQRCLSVDRL